MFGGDDRPLTHDVSVDADADSYRDCFDENVPLSGAGATQGHKWPIAAANQDWHSPSYVCSWSHSYAYTAVASSASTIDATRAHTVTTEMAAAITIITAELIAGFYCFRILEINLSFKLRCAQLDTFCVYAWVIWCAG